MKIHKILYYLYIHVQSVKTYNWTVHEYKCLFWLLSFFKLRERESGKRNLGIKEKCPQSYLSYFRRGSTGESFFFYGLIDFALFLVLAWGTRVSHVSVNLLSSTRSKVAMVRLPAMNPAQKLNSSYLLPLRGREPHFRFVIPANHLTSLSFPFRCPATWGH